MWRITMAAGAVSALFGTAIAGPVADKCAEAMASIGAANIEEGCACFETEIEGSLAEEYLALDLDNWSGDASDALKEAAAACFPDDNTNE